VLSQLDPFPGDMIAKNTAGFPSSGVGATGTSVGEASVGVTVAVTTMTSAVGDVLEQAASASPNSIAVPKIVFLIMISSGYFEVRFYEDIRL
jgi:hypothetical protein